jgi:hypothetical protein
MKYETELFTGAGGGRVAITVDYAVEAETVQINYIQGPVWVSELNKFVMGDITQYIDEYAYEGIKDEIYQIVEKSNEDL